MSAFLPWILAVVFVVIAPALALVLVPDLDRPRNDEPDGEPRDEDPEDTLIAA